MKEEKNSKSSVSEITERTLKPISKLFLKNLFFFDLKLNGRKFGFNLGFFQHSLAEQ